MDKRSLIAIFLTFVLLLAWQIFFISPAQKKDTARLKERGSDTVAVERRAERAEEEKDRVVEEERKGVEESAAGDVLLPGGDEPSGEIELIIRTALAEYRMSSAGGEFRNIKLLEYPGLDNRPVEIVPEGETGAAMISFITGEGREIGMSGRSFLLKVDGEPVKSSREIELAGEGETAEVVFLRDGEDGGMVEKRFTFRRSSYEVGLKIKIRREGAIRSTSSYELSWDCGMAVTEEDRDSDLRNFATMGRVGEEIYEQEMDDFDEDERRIHQGTIVWSGSRSKYFLSAFIPGQQRAGGLVMFGDEEENLAGHGVRYYFRGDPRMVEDEFTCYIGPLDINRLEEYDIGLEKTVELGWLRFFSVFILKLMIFLRRFIANYGVIIILISLMTKILFYRLTHKSFKSMKEMQKVQPKIKELQEKYKDDKEKLNKEMMKIYKEGGVNPLGGCLPLLLQMPVFIALFNVLRNTIEIRKAPFVLWINDLSSPDVLFDMGVSIPFLGSEFHLLPILMGGAMYLQSKLGGSPTGGAAPAGQAKMMSTFMPIIFTFFFYRMPSGLVLYWLVNNIISIIQQYYIHRDMDEVEEKGDEKGENKSREKGGKK